MHLCLRMSAPCLLVFRLCVSLVNIARWIVAALATRAREGRIFAAAVHVSACLLPIAFHGVAMWPAWVMEGVNPVSSEEPNGGNQYEQHLISFDLALSHARLFEHSCAPVHAPWLRNSCTRCLSSAPA